MVHLKFCIVFKPCNRNGVQAIQIGWRSCRTLILYIMCVSVTIYR